jgi:hypothetical protein
MSDILDQVIDGKQDAYTGSGESSATLAEGYYKAKAGGYTLKESNGRVSLELRTSEGTVFEGFMLGGAAKGLPYLLGCAKSAGIKYTGMKVSGILKKLQGKTVYFWYKPGDLKEDGSRGFHKVSFMEKRTWEAAAARAGKRTETKVELGEDEIDVGEPAPADAKAPTKKAAAGADEGDDFLDVI